MKKTTSTLLLLAGYALTAWADRGITVTVANPASAPRTDAPVVVSLANYGDVRSALVTCDGREIACQLDDLDGDETYDELCFLADLGGKEKKKYTVTLSEQGEPRSYKARVYAEMVLSNSKDKKLKKHQQNNYIEAITARGDAAYTYNIQHHHGVDFESELNGIRIVQQAAGTAADAVLHPKGAEGERLRRRRALGGTDVRARGLPRMGRTAADAGGPRALALTARGQLRTAARHRGGDRPRMEGRRGQGSRQHDAALHAVCRSSRHRRRRVFQQGRERLPVLDWHHQREGFGRVYRPQGTARLLGYRLSVDRHRQLEAGDGGAGHLRSAEEHSERGACQQGQLRLRHPRGRQTSGIQGQLYVGQRVVRIPHGQRMV